MRGSRFWATAVVVAGALVATSGAVASGGGPGGGGSGTQCVPLVTSAGVGHTEASDDWHIAVRATVGNCTAANHLYHVKVSVPGSSEAPFNADTGLPPNCPVTRIVSPSGSTPLQLYFGQTYTVVTTLTRTTVSPAQVLSTVNSTVTIPATTGS